MQCDARTHVGNVASHNEDTVFGNDNEKLWIVSDGMGGHAAGEVASDMVVKGLQASYAKGESLPSAVESVHKAVVYEAQKTSATKGMGATVVAMNAVDDSYRITWVGDSRAYMLRRNKLQLLTRDHSYLEYLKANGIAVEEARQHPKRHVITQCIGNGDPHPCEVNGVIKPGDRFLLCSDGLNDELTRGEILSILRSTEPSDVVSEKLINAALEKGGRDNVSVIVIDADPVKRNPFFLPIEMTAHYLASINSKILLPVAAGITLAMLLAVVLIILR